MHAFFPCHHRKQPGKSQKSGYAPKIALRYLTASKAQTALLVFGVAIGVFIFIFMSALIGGLAEFIMARTAGDMAHVTH